MSPRMVFITLLLLGLSFDSTSFATESESTDKQRLTQEIADIEKKCKEEKTCTEQDVAQLEQKKGALDSLKETFKFGLGIGFEHYKDAYISEVETIGDSRTVRIVDSQDYKPGLWLDTHYIWDGIAKKKLGRTHSAPGFYVGARLLGGESDVFDAFSLGFLSPLSQPPIHKETLHRLLLPSRVRREARATSSRSSSRPRYREQSRARIDIYAQREAR